MGNLKQLLRSYFKTPIHDDFSLYKIILFVRNNYFYKPLLKKAIIIFQFARPDEWTSSLFVFKHPPLCKQKIRVDVFQILINRFSCRWFKINLFFLSAFPLEGIPKLFSTQVYIKTHTREFTNSLYSIVVLKHF